MEPAGASDSVCISAAKGPSCALSEAGFKLGKMPHGYSIKDYTSLSTREVASTARALVRKAPKRE